MPNLKEEQMLIMNVFMRLLNSIFYLYQSVERVVMNNFGTLLRLERLPPHAVGKNAASSGNQTRYLNRPAINTLQYRGA